MTSWGVVATLDEPAVLVEAFVAWHLAQGAAEVHLYFDRPDDPAGAKVTQLPGVYVTYCDAAHWAKTERGERGTRQTNRQMNNVVHAQERAGVEWLLHCDGDEFVRDGAVLMSKLTTLPDSAKVVSLQTFERVALLDVATDHIFSGAFRRPDPDFSKWGEEVYGRFAKFLISGLSGHAAGKVLVRQGSGLRPLIHGASDQDRAHYPPDVRLSDMLLHFDGLTPRHFAAKMLRRVELAHYVGNDSPDPAARQHQIRALRNKGNDPKALEKMINGIKGITAGQATALDQLGVIETLSFDPRPAMAALGIATDTSIATFDAAIATRFEAEFATFEALGALGG